MDNSDSDVQQSVVQAGEHTEHMEGRSFTLRALISGLLIGVLVNLSNTYYGLRIGAGSSMSMVSGLLGYVGFRSFSKYTTMRFSPAENVLVISVATATGCMPVTAGFIGIIPALEYLIGPDENGPLRVEFGNLVLWSIGLCFFGIVFASLFREHFIEREKLPWPGARATAHLINTLHRRPQKSPAGSRNMSSDTGSNREDDHVFGRQEHEPLLAQTNNTDWKAGLNSLLRGTFASGIISVLMYFIPILHELPIFGRQAASRYLWTVDLSPGFFGQGIIIGPAISSHMLIGAIVGWGILSPYAKYRGWAPGEVDDWATGSRGWIIWVSLASLFADASVKLAWILLRPIWKDYFASGYLQTQLTAFWENYARHQPARPRESQYSPVLDEMDDDSNPSQDRLTRRIFWVLSSDRHSVPQDNEFEAPATSRVTVLGLLVSITVCVLAVHLIFGNIIPWYYTLLAIALSLPMAIVGIRCIAETDYNPESALVSQLVFAALVSHSDPNAIIINLISAAIAQAGANQSGEIAYDFKVGHLVGARPGAQVQGQIIGSLFGALISCGIYRMYASYYPIPGPFFRIPSSFLVLSTARLLLGQGLPEGVAPFAMGAAILSMLATIVKMQYSTRWWQMLVPSGVSIAIGIYLLPSFSITRAVGGLFYWAYIRYFKGRKDDIIILASGLVLGESIASLISLTLVALQAPQLGGK